MSHTHEHSLAHRPPQGANGSPDKLHVIAVISNPIRYTSRYALFRKFEQFMLREPLVQFHVVEQAFGRRPFEVTDSSSANHLQLRTYDELWHKENMVNLGVQRLPADWKYVAWIDADIEFQRKDWVTETLQQLQHFMIVQMFQTAVDLGSTGETMGVHNGFAWSYLSGKPRPKKQASGYSYPHWHPGYAWAMRREAWEALGGLYDVSILGSGDHLMAWSLIGENMLPDSMSDGYKKSLADWQGRAVRLINHDIGFVPGTIVHFYHGHKSNRKYQSRWQILERSKFDPFLDLKRDWQGLYQLDTDGSARMIGLRDDIRQYLRVRDEDGVLGL
jgi:hypothetical protein